MPASNPPKSTRTRRATADADTPVSYELALAELEQLVSQLDAGQLPLDQLLTHYRRGAVLLSFCRSRLIAVEQQIQQLDHDELKPWEGA